MTKFFLMKPPKNAWKWAKSVQNNPLCFGELWAGFFGFNFGEYCLSMKSRKFWKAKHQINRKAWNFSLFVRFMGGYRQNNDKRVSVFSFAIYFLVKSGFWHIRRLTKVSITKLQLVSLLASSIFMADWGWIFTHYNYCVESILYKNHLVSD